MKAAAALVLSLASLASPAMAFGGLGRASVVRASLLTTRAHADVDVDRRTALSGVVAAAITAAAGTAAPVGAIGPVSMDLDGITYQVLDECPPSLKEGRIGGSLGAGARQSVTQSCVNVKCTVTNPTKKPLKDTAVFGFVVDEASGASMIANNPDFRSDAGQFATIDTIPPGEHEIDFVFVATYNKREQGVPSITFKSLKAISYPGGARFQELSPCELDSLSDECDEVSDEERKALKEKKMRY